MECITYFEFTHPLFFAGIIITLLVSAYIVYNKKYKTAIAAFIVLMLISIFLFASFDSCDKERYPNLYHDYKTEITSDKDAFAIFMKVEKSVTEDYLKDNLKKEKNKWIVYMQGTDYVLYPDGMLYAYPNDYKGESKNW